MLRDLTDDRRTGRVRELGQLLEMLAELLARTRRFERRTDEERPLCGRMEIDSVSRDSSTCSAKEISALRRTSS